MRRPRIAERHRLASAPVRVSLAILLRASKAREVRRAEEKARRARARASRRRASLRGDSLAEEAERPGPTTTAQRRLVPRAAAQRPSREATLGPRVRRGSASHFRRCLPDYLARSSSEHRAPARVAASSGAEASLPRLLVDPRASGGVRPCAEVRGGLSCCLETLRIVQAALPVRGEQPLAVLSGASLAETTNSAAAIPASISEGCACSPMLPKFLPWWSEPGRAGPPT